MAFASGYVDDLDTTSSKNEETRQECFHIWFHYLRSEDVVDKCFIKKLPPYITSIEKTKKIWKG